MNMVHAKCVSPPDQTQKIIHIAAVIAMTQGYSRGIDAFRLEDAGLLLATPHVRARMRFNRESRGLAGSRRSPQGPVFKIRNVVAQCRHLDHPGIDCRAVDSLTDLPDEELRQFIG